MSMGLRRLLVTLPIALSVAAAAHGARFGDEHAFGKEYHDWICTLVLAGLPALAWAFLARAAAALTTYGDGSILADRLAELLPGRGRFGALTASIAGLASAIYIGIERLEVDGDRSYVFALAIIVVISICVAIATRWALEIVASATIAFFRRLVAALSCDAPPRALRPSRARATPRVDWATVRLGRAPPLAA